MSSGLDITFRLLAKTDNDSAMAVLLAALDSPYVEIQDAALEAILRRRNLAGHREVLRRVPTIPQRWRLIITRSRGQMIHAMREAVLGNDQQMCYNACQVAIWTGDYELIPALLVSLETAEGAKADLAVETLMCLVERLCGQLAESEQSEQGNWRATHRYVLENLEASVGRFGRHKRREVIEAFLMLASRDNALLRRILDNPYHGAFLVIVDLLSKSQHPAIVQLLLSFMEDPSAPSAAISITANRSDVQFIRHFLRCIAGELSPAMLQNLRRIESIAWLKTGGAILGQLDEQTQQAAIRLATTTGVPRSVAFGVIEYLLLYGKPAARQQAAKALAKFSGAEANALCLRTLDDPDPQVQANLVGQLRRRGIPGVLPRLVELLDSPHAVVRRAARESLADFNFKRFLGAFDVLDDQMRETTGKLIKRIDPKTIPMLRDELRSAARGRRLRALAIARCLEAVEQLEEQIVELLSDDDHMVRAEAAALLAQSKTPTSRAALEEALYDRSETVQNAARSSLESRGEFERWRQMLADPRD